MTVPKRESTYVRQIVDGGKFCNDVMKEIRRNTSRANMVYVVCHSSRNLNFQVTEHARPD
ncbi:hypothetical protein PVK06_017097 [Gossypium arboreum]|uniref:Uncharacterized protein n=1 Tax=Gossypium arboreum TaxID=29729 RepID=A0ABR0Q286_GOSAR|nr:hypothetical protein PVK06_017097 [Gossypium arboreum]